MTSNIIPFRNTGGSPPPAGKARPKPLTGRATDPQAEAIRDWDAEEYRRRCRQPAHYADLRNGGLMPRDPWLLRWGWWYVLAAALGLVIGVASAAGLPGVGP